MDTTKQQSRFGSSMLDLGDYTIQTLRADNFRLDGGAMFGSVPKTLWERLIPADEKNRIQLTCRLMLVKGHGHTILVDTGMGSKWTDKERSIYSIEPHATDETLNRLAPLVTDVLLTHLHFDHAGGVSRTTLSGELDLVFQNAVHYVSAKNLHHAKSPGLRERASYLAQNIEPLERTRLVLTEHGQEVLPGVTVHQVHGHTPGLQYILIRGVKGTVAYPADLIPTAHHVPVPYVMGYDLCAQTSMAEKELFLCSAVAEQWVVVFEHDAQMAAARIEQSADGKYRAVPMTDHADSLNI